MSTMFRTGRRLALLGMLAIGMAACGDDAEEGTAPADISGEYTLATLNNQAPPVTVLEIPGYKGEVLGGTLDIAAGGTWSQVIALRETENGVVTELDDIYSGTWTRTGNSIRFVADEETFDATVRSDGAIVFPNISGSGFTARFTK